MAAFGGKKKQDKESVTPETGPVLVKKTASRSAGKKQNDSNSMKSIATQRGRARTVHPSLLRYTLIFIYKNLYILGITVLRRLRHFHRQVRLWVSIVRGRCYAGMHHFSSFWVGVWRRLVQRVRAPFTRIAVAYEKQKPYISNAREQGKLPPVLLLPVLEPVWRLIWTILSTLFSHAAPIVAAVFLASVIRAELNKPIILLLEYDGQQMGYIQNEAVFDQATQILRERTLDQNISSMSIKTPQLSVTERDDSLPVLSSTELADRIIEMSGSEVEQAYGLYVNNVFLGAVTDSNAIISEMKAIQDENRTGKPNEEVEFTKKIAFNPALYPVESLVDVDSLVARLRREERTEEIYIVQEGDSPSLISDKTGTPYATLIAYNPGIETDLMPGMELKTAAARPFLSVQNSYTDTYEVEIPYTTVEEKSPEFANTYKAVKQEGVNGSRLVTARITMLDGIETNREILNANDPNTIISEAVEQIVVVGTNNPVSQIPSGGGSIPPSVPASGGWMWPTNGGWATTYYGHTGNGIDIAPGGAGHPIYASRAGVVTAAVRGYTGYGHYVIIDHGDGFQSLYAHHSEIYVSVGQHVEQGQVIAAMGRTGWATGNHVHFEIRYNGRYTNPRDYVGSYG